MSSNIQVNVEYCRACGHIKQFLEMSDKIKKLVPDAEVSGIPGRQASFEVKVNDELVYSKLQRMAFPDFDEVSNMVKGVSEGEGIRQIRKEQEAPCSVM